MHGAQGSGRRSPGGGGSRACPAQLASSGEDSAAHSQAEEDLGRPGEPPEAIQPPGLITADPWQNTREVRAPPHRSLECLVVKDGVAILPWGGRIAEARDAAAAVFQEKLLVAEQAVGAARAEEEWVRDNVPGALPRQALPLSAWDVDRLVARLIAEGLLEPVLAPAARAESGHAPPPRELPRSAPSSPPPLTQAGPAQPRDGSPRPVGPPPGFFWNGDLVGPPAAPEARVSLTEALAPRGKAGDCLVRCVDHGQWRQLRHCMSVDFVRGMMTHRCYAKNRCKDGEPGPESAAAKEAAAAKERSELREEKAEEALGKGAGRG